MKNSIFTMIALLVLPLFIQAQSNNDYNYVGQYHNDGLDRLVPTLTSVPDPNDVDGLGILEDFFNGIGGEFEGVNFTGVFNQEFLNEMARVYDQDLNGYLNAKMAEGAISPELYGALVQVFNIINNAPDIPTLIDWLKDLLNPSPTFPNPFEDIIFFSTVAVGVNSAEYWHNKLHEENNECCDAAYLEMTILNATRDIIATDAGCAVGGAMAGAAAGGVGAAPGAAIGACAGSAAKGVEILVTKAWNWLFG